MSFKDLWVPGYTLKHLVIAYDTKLLTEWDHTSTIYAGLFNLSIVVMNLATKTKAKPKTPNHFHPFRLKKREGIRITAANIEDLRMIGQAFVGQ